MTVPSTFAETISLVISGLMVAGIIALIAFGRKLIALPQQMILVMAALFRMLKSNRLSGVAIKKIAAAMKSGGVNGETDDAVKAIETDQEKMDLFFKLAAFTKPKDLEKLLKDLGEED